MDLDTGSQFTLAFLLVAFLMCGLWLYQVWSQDAGIVDVGWSGSLGVLALLYAQTMPSATWRTWVVATMAATWSVRLALYLFFDRVLGKPEDGRYRKLRLSFGSWSQLFFFVFFQAQAILAWVFALSFWIAMRKSGPFAAGDAAGIALWAISISGETLADRQLAKFRSNPSNKGKTCREGLWNYSRHPNYFFEWLHWWSYVAIAWSAPFGWVTLTAPALMWFFLFRVTGIPATEAQAVISRGDDYKLYQQTTSMFVPWFPKKP